MDTPRVAVPGVAAAAGACCACVGVGMAIGYWLSKRHTAAPEVTTAAHRAERLAAAKQRFAVVPENSVESGDTSRVSHPLPVRKFDHTAVEALDVEASRAFYCGVLGFRPIPRPPFTSKGYWLAQRGIKLHIAECATRERREYRLIERVRSETRGWEGLPASGNHTALVVDDLDACEAQLTAAGIPFKRVDARGVSCAQQVFLFDPDGNAIELSTDVCPEFDYDATSRA